MLSRAMMVTLQQLQYFLAPAERGSRAVLAGDTGPRAIVESQLVLEAEPAPA